MEQDALRAGVAPGGLLSTAEVRILICYILSTAQEPVPGKRLAELLHYEGLANYFEVEEGIHALLEQRQISAADEPDAYCITPSGRDAAETLRTSLPFTVREKAYQAAARMLARRRHERETKIEILPQGAGRLISCAVNEGDRELMTIRLYVADEGQAQMIRDRFLEDPSGIYADVLERMTGSTMHRPDPKADKPAPDADEI